MSAAPDDGVRDGVLSLVTAQFMTGGTYEYAINYLGYWLDQAVQANPGLEYVDVASHSTGNVLARAYIQRPAYGATYVDAGGVTRRLPRIRYYIAGAGINEGTIHSWRPWSGNFEDVLSGFIPTTELEGRLSALAFAGVIAGAEITGPDYAIALRDLLRPDRNWRLAPDATTFFRLYNPMRRQLMATTAFLTPPGARAPVDIDSDPTLSPTVVLDLNALSSPGHNPWATHVGIPGGKGGVIATFATGARERGSVLDFVVPGLINDNPYICTAIAITQLKGEKGEFLPLLDLLQYNPDLVKVRDAPFPRIGDEEPRQQLNGDGNGFMDSYLSTLSGDPNVRIVTWGNGSPPPRPPAPPRHCVRASAVPTWDRETDFPVYHDAFYYNPDVRRFIVETITDRRHAPETVITPAELVELAQFVDGRRSP